jgi:hypothetical protein
MAAGERNLRSAGQRLLDFDVAIESAGSGYRTRVVASPAGEASTDFAFPFNDQDLEILVLKVVASIGWVRRSARQIKSQERRLLEDFGGQLFGAAFSGPVGERLASSRLIAESRQAGLRIRLRLPPSLASIPWEYMHDEEYGFIALSPETALVRYPEMARPVRPLLVSPPLRILGMISAPVDLPALDGEEEWARLNDTLGELIGRGTVEVERLEAGTLAALQRPLRQRDYHVLHFVGHGGWLEDAHEGALALEDPDRKTRLVTGRDLGMMIRGRSIRLVVLNACEGARNDSSDPFGGVAQALMRQGIPAVIAMQFEISDPAALVFGLSFYQAIADGLPVDVAMLEARRAMFAEGHEVEWATPVLYLRSPDGRVFTKGRMSAARQPASEEAELPVMERRATVTGEAGYPAAARDQYAALLAVAERVLGSEHPQTLAARDGLARWTGEAGDAAAARDLYAALLPVAERVLGPELPQTLAARGGLAYWTGRAGDPAAARDRSMGLLAVAERVLGPEHPQALAARDGLARWTGEAGDAAAARDLYAALLPVAERVLGPEHPQTLTTRNNLARWTAEAGDAAGARDLFAALLPVRSRVLGPEHPDTLTTRNNLSNATGEAGDAAGARDLFAALLPVYERVLGPEHPQTLTTRNNLAAWTGQAGDAAAARDLFAALLPVRSRVLGPEHPDTLITRNNLARWTGKAGDAAGARDLFAALLPVRRRVLGPGHPETLATQGSLAYWTGQAEAGAG